MTDTALVLAEIRALRAEFAEFRARVERQRDTLSLRQRALYSALELVLGNAAFTSCEVLELARQPLGNRPRLAAALAALGVDNAHRLGLALRAIADVRVGLVDAGRENGSRLWRIEESGA